MQRLEAQTGSPEWRKRSGPRVTWQSGIATGSAQPDVPQALYSTQYDAQNIR